LLEGVFGAMPDKKDNAIVNIVCGMALLTAEVSPL
jgi:hypothetical protein